MFVFPSMRRALGAALNVGLVLAALGTVALAQDKVTTKDQKIKDVKIVSENFDNLIVSLEGGTSGMRWKDIDSIKYSNADKYYKAVNAFTAGSVSDSIPQLEELNADTKLRPVLKHNVLYYLGMAYLKTGAADKSLAMHQELLKTFPKSRYLLQVGANVANISVARKDAAGAQRTLDAAATAAAAPKESAIQAAFDLLKGRLLEEQEKFTEAESTYDRILSNPKAEGDLQPSAKLGKARCAHRANRAIDAERQFRDLLSADAPNYVLAGAANGLGDLWLAQGTANRDADMIKDALLAYLRGKVMYIPERDSSTEEYERALAGAALANTALSQLEPNADRKKLYQSRAKQLKDELTRDYPQSRYLAAK